MKMVTAFSLVIAPLIIFLYYITLYSMDVVRVQVAQSNQNLLSTYVQQMDQSISNITSYLYKQILNDTDLKTLGLYEFGSGAFDLSQVSTIKKMNQELNNHPVAGALFVYHKDSDHFIVSYRDRTVYQSLDALKQHMSFKEFNTPWIIIPYESNYALTKIVSFDSKVFIGAWIPLLSLTEIIQPFRFGQEGDIFLISNDGIPLTRSSLSEAGLNRLQQTLRENVQSYKVLKDPHTGVNRLTLWKRLEKSDLHLVISIPEKNVLLQLPFYKKVIYIIPLVCLVILCLYFIMMRNILLVPMNHLLTGMRKMVRGDLQVKLQENHSSEFSFLIKTFNQMVADIRDLKINMYEDRIKVQEAEFKHLQAQINPHFYLNTLNIIYNSAVLKDFETVKTISLHLADYFRFRIRTNRDEVCLEEEIAFVEGYLTIQKLRFMELLSYTIDMDSTFLDHRLPPLIVQPFVENCIIHGFKGDIEHLHIHIEVKPSRSDPDHYFEIVVTDNGIGFPSNQLELMNQITYFTGSTDSHIGLWNVYHRLQMKYNNRASIRFQNEEPQGAAVIVKIPL
ncbi:sensor histidine kinase [Paenibacillus prosopidis]|uniref:Two-component system sensor histidine kinase YesM n=1 Tax=Paenibacillus prosopidis TaxID=630520 RepID=A0A368VMW4_9BACL|nr:histidine kinase [Paenibacillus prosopidis]RCW43059.1 two-component system sensor histidine kinase YesM [Paenibacillus prosopidis]